MDSLDQKIVARLRENARLPVSNLAQVCGVSRKTVQTRLERMLQSGAILGFTVRVRHGAETAAVKAIMTIEVAGGPTAAVVARLKGMPQLRAIHTTNGRWDLVAEIIAGSLEELDGTLAEVRSTKGVLNSETSILLTSA